MSLEESLRSLSLDYLNLLINGQAFSDVTFQVEGRLVHAHRCILAARSLFFRKFFCGPDPPCGLDPVGASRGSPGPTTTGSSRSPAGVIPVNSVGYEVFLLLLQFLYSGQVSIVPQKHEARPNCGERGCWHTHCTSAVDLALDTLAAARYFGVEQLALLTQKQLASMVEKASIEDVMKVLLASRKQEMQQLWTTCSHLVAKSGLPPEVLAKHLPIDLVAKIEELRLKSSLSRRSLIPSPYHHPHHHHHHDLTVVGDIEDQKIRRMRRALDSSDVELVKLMVMGEGLNLDEALALHYAVENCSREVVKALLELGAADVNFPAGPAGKTPLHVAAEMVSPDMVAVLLDHHADPNVRTVDGVTPLDILRTLTSDFLFKGAVPGLTHIEPNKLRLCLELVQSAALVLSREEGNANPPSSATAIYPPPLSTDHHQDHSGNLDSRLVYLNLGASGSGQMGSGGGDEDSSSHSSHNQREAMNRHGSQGGGCDPTMYHHHHSHHDY
ncbi:regulatory protein NPR5-like [Arachis ipaensis]|uniref:regulatory protein NPR5-like n=1 Tax=Arachis ipaensis TaxID=130454 RepID=UPI0007AF2F30|nr:regulatory protein NPR5-like [Arachis ipaensis]XP_025633152.1 BTB/POZ domain and ankyrin repeat-containing protein COCH [Arachis hypogaea]QHO24120.1 Regulatory protein [Arachis hypogaea]